MKISRNAKRVLVVLGVLPAVLAVFIFIFIGRYATAHDEERCPFREHEVRELAGSAISVREETRRCLSEIEEHRWLPVREGRAGYELGRWPVETRLGPDALPWRAELEDGRIVVTVTNGARGDLVFREPPPSR